MQNIENRLKELFVKNFAESPSSIEKLPVSGSARCYYRIKTSEFFLNDNNKLDRLKDFKDSKEFSCIATWNDNVEENKIFLEFTEHFRKAKLNVPKIYAVAEDKKCYLQQDLGDMTLLNFVEQYSYDNGVYQVTSANTFNKNSACKQVPIRKFNSSIISSYKKVLLGLIKFQLYGGENLDYSLCVPRPVFDERCVMWDLNYFKYCFLKLMDSNFSEDRLEDDFEKLTSVVCTELQDVFMFRDFQSRNIMVFKEDIFFLDYQGGRLGAIYYDLASLLYDPIADIPDAQREELLDYYIGKMGEYRCIDKSDFKKNYYNFVLIRLLQALGAFGLRGLYEKKEIFIASIVPGIKTLLKVLDKVEIRGQYLEILNSCKDL